MGADNLKIDGNRRNENDKTKTQVSIYEKGGTQREMGVSGCLYQTYTIQPLLLQPHANLGTLVAMAARGWVRHFALRPGPGAPMEGRS